MSRIATLLLPVLVLFVGAVFTAAPAYALPHPVLVADAKSDVCAGIGLSGASCSGTGQTTPTSQLDTLITTIINVLTVIVGVIAVIMIIVAGAKFITSNGDTSKVASAKSSIIYAIIGLVVVVLAQTIVHYVVNKANV